MEKIKKNLKEINTNIVTCIKRDKFVLIILLIGYLALIYTSLNTFSGNDDLPYSFLYRGNDRIETLRTSNIK
ncbi:MAG: hypothetical protein ACLU8F_05745 [Clostridia bacterium]